MDTGYLVVLYHETAHISVIGQLGFHRRYLYVSAIDFPTKFMSACIGVFCQLRNRLWCNKKDVSSFVVVLVFCLHNEHRNTQVQTSIEIEITSRLHNSHR